MGTNVRRQLDGNYQNYLRRVLTDGGTYEQIPTVQFIDQYNKIIAYNPSMVVFPSSKKTGTLYTVLPNSSSGDFTVTRASSGSYFDRNGIIRTAIANEPRLDYDPTTRQFNGVLVEPAATNMFAYSEQFDNAYWVKQAGFTMQTASAIAPNNTQTAITFGKSTGVNTLVSIIKGIPIYTTTGLHTLSYYVKNINSSTALSRVDAGGNTANVTINFNTETISTAGANLTTASLQKLNNGWYRVIATGNVTSTSWTADIANLFSEPSGSQVLVWGAQLETGSVATSYIPTTTTTASRAADVITRTGASSLIGQTQGSVYIEFVVTQTSLLTLFSLSNGGVSARLIPFVSGNSFVLFLQNNLGSVVYSINNSVNVLRSGTNKLLLSYQEGAHKYFLNGSLLQNINASMSNITFSKINLGSFQNDVATGNTNLKLFALYTRALDDASAIELTRL